MRMIEQYPSHVPADVLELRLPRRATFGRDEALKQAFEGEIRAARSSS